MLTKLINKISEYLSEYFLYVFIICFFIISAYSSYIFAPLGIKQTDSIDFFVYANAIVKNNILSFGQLGLWDNISGAGYPLIGHLSATFYPINFLTFFFSNQILADRIIVIIHLILASLSMFWLLNFLGSKRIFSLYGAIIYVINFPVESIVNQGLDNEIINLYLTPLILLFTWKALFSREKRYSVLVGVFLAFHILGVSLYSVYFNGIIIFFLFLCFVLQSRSKIVDNLKHALAVSVMVLAIGIGLSAVKLFPTLHYAFLSMRNSLPLYGVGNPFAPSWEPIRLKDAIQQVYFFLTVGNPTIFTKYIVINCLFIFFVFCSLFSRSKKVYFFVFLTVMAFWASFTNHYKVDIYQLFYYLFPGFKTIEHPSRFFIISNFTLPILAAFGGSYLFNKSKYHYFRKAFTVMVFLSFLTVSFFVYNQLFHAYYQDEKAAIKAQQKENFNEDITRLLKNKEKVHVESLYNQSFNRLNEVFSYSAYINKFKLTNLLHTDFSLSYQYFPLSKLVMTYDNGLKENKKIGSLFASDFTYKKYKLLSLLNTKYILMDNLENDYPNTYIAPVLSHTDGKLYQLNTYEPFVSEVSNAILLLGDNRFNDFDSFKAKYLMLDHQFNINESSIFTSSKEYIDDFSYSDLKNFKFLILSSPRVKNKNQVEKLLNRYVSNGGKILYISFKNKEYEDIRYRFMSVMTKNPAQYLSKNDQLSYEDFIGKINSDYQGKSKIIIEKDTPENIIFTVKTERETTFIRLADTFYPGWSVFIDGKKSNMYMADGLLKGIYINGVGMHTINFEFKPYDFYVGAIISAVTIVSLLPLLLFL